MDQCGDLTQEQLKLLFEFKRRMKDEVSTELYDDTFMFYRFLKGRNFNLNQAETMLKKHLNCRKIYGLDTILRDFKPTEVMLKHANQDVIGYDKMNNIIRFWAVGGLDSKGITKCENKFELYKFSLYLIEKSLHLVKLKSKEIGVNVTKCLLIFDLENLTLETVTNKSAVEFFVSVLLLMIDNCPERLKCLHIINASVYFAMVWPFIKVVLPTTIVEKIRIYGKDGWKEALLNDIDPEVLPACLGGTRTDPNGDPKCRSILTWGGKIPEHYYLTKNIDIFASQPGVMRELIPRRSAFSVDIYVDETGSHLCWEFETAKDDIGFMIVLEETKKKSVTVMPLHRYETELKPIKGRVECERTGTHVIVFDNSHSRFKAKEVYYRVWLSYSDEKRHKEFIK